MLTRSQSSKLTIENNILTNYVIEIDFDDASREWNANKKRIGQMYAYICNVTLSNGKRCRRRVYRDRETCFCHCK